MSDFTLDLPHGDRFAEGYDEREVKDESWKEDEAKEAYREALARLKALTQKGGGPHD